MDDKRAPLIEVLRIQGQTPLVGTAALHGSKNAVLPCLAACVLVDGSVTLENVPKLDDVDTMVELLHYLGVETEPIPTGYHVMASGPLEPVAPEYIARRMRASFLVVGPLLARVGHARVALPGGCSIGVRPIDLHLRGFEQMGARVTQDDNYVRIEAPHLKGADIALDLPSVGATENLMMAAVLAHGHTTLRNAAMEPEIQELGRLLAALGAHIDGVGSPVIHIEGRSSLVSSHFYVRSDRIEAATYLLAGAVTGGRVTVEPIQPDDLGIFLAKCEEAGGIVSCQEDRITLKGPGHARAVKIVTRPFPGFPTDLQAPFMSWLARGLGTSVLTETVFERRFGHVQELNRMGAQIRIDGRVATIVGVPRLVGTAVEASDLRAAASLVLAGLSAGGETIVAGLGHLDRGYQDMADTLRRLGAAIERTKISSYHPEARV